MAVEEDAAGDPEIDIPMLAPGVFEDSAVASGRRWCRRASWRLGVAALAAALLLAVASSRLLVGRGLRATSWSEGDDVTLEFDWNLFRQYKRFKQKVRGLSGTCLSADQCVGNAGTAKRSCKGPGNCTDLAVAYCCTKPEKKPKIDVHHGEVSCTCSSTSRMFEKFKGFREKFKGSMRKKLKMEHVRDVFGSPAVDEHSTVFR